MLVLAHAPAAPRRSMARLWRASLSSTQILVAEVDKVDPLVVRQFPQLAQQALRLRDCNLEARWPFEELTMAEFLGQLEDQCWGAGHATYVCCKFNQLKLHGVGVGSGLFSK